MVEKVHYTDATMAIRTIRNLWNFCLFTTNQLSNILAIFRTDATASVLLVVLGLLYEGIYARKDALQENDDREEGRLVFENEMKINKTIIIAETLTKKWLQIMSKR